MKKLLDHVIKKSVLLRCLSRTVYTVFLRSRYFVTTAGIKTDKKTVLFEAFNGKSYCDSPKQVYLRMLADKRFADYRFIWAFSQPEKYSFLEQNPHTHVVRANGVAFERTLKESSVWITNFRIDYYPVGRTHRYVQCWHGTPLKKLGYDIEYCRNSMNSIHEFQKKYLLDAKKFSYLISPSPYTTEKFTSAFCLKLLGKENAILEVGYPRNDVLRNYAAAHAKAARSSLGIPDGKKIILYAPTWRDDCHESGVGYSLHCEIDFSMLLQKIGSKAVILFRAHQFIVNELDFHPYNGFIYDVSDYDDIADLYIISDVLVTDYSSVFFDYANLSRPIVFYMYDFENYAGRIRDLYLPLSELPGEIVKTNDALADALETALKGNFQPDARYRRFQEKFNPLDDGNASLRVIQKLFPEGESIDGDTNEAVGIYENIFKSKKLPKE